MTRYLGLDPDTHSTGWALLGDDGLVEACGLIRIGTVKNAAKKSIKATGLKSIERMCRAIDEHFQSRVPDTIAFVEAPVIHPGKVVRPNDIVRLGFVAGACALAAWRVADDVRMIEPRAWKGTVPKMVHQARILRNPGVNWDQWPDVTPGLRTHVIDAIGLAWWGRAQARSRAPQPEPALRAG